MLALYQPVNQFILAKRVDWFIAHKFVELFTKQNLAQKVFRGQKAQGFRVSSPQSLHEVHVGLTALHEPKLEQQLANQVEIAVLANRVGRVIECQNAHAIQEDHKVLERELGTSVVLLRAYYASLISVVRQ